MSLVDAEAARAGVEVADAAATMMAEVAPAIASDAAPAKQMHASVASLDTGAAAESAMKPADPADASVAVPAAAAASAMPTDVAAIPGAATPMLVDESAPALVPDPKPSPAPEAGEPIAPSAREDALAEVRAPSPPPPQQIAEEQLSPHEPPQQQDIIAAQEQVTSPPQADGESAAMQINEQPAVQPTSLHPSDADAARAVADAAVSGVPSEADAPAADVSVDNAGAAMELAAEPPPASFPAFPSLTPSPPSAAPRSPPVRAVGLESLIRDSPMRSPPMPALEPPTSSPPPPLAAPVRVKVEQESPAPAAAATSASATPAAVSAAATVPLPSFIDPTPTAAAPRPRASRATDAINRNHRPRMITAHALPPAAVPVVPAPAATHAPAPAPAPAPAASVTPAKRKQTTATAHSSAEANGRSGSGKKGKTTDSARKRKKGDLSGSNVDFDAFAHPASAQAKQRAAAANATASVIDDLLEFDTLTQAEAKRDAAEQQRLEQQKLDKHRQTHASTRGSSAAASTASASAAAAALEPSSTPSSGATECAVCLTAMTSHGNHCAACLKCGHVLGYSCAHRWVSENRKCPQCKATASVKDLRRLFVPSIVVADTGALAAAQERIQALSAELLQMKSESAKQQADYLKLLNKYENMSASVLRAQHQRVVDGNKGGVTLTYIMSPVASPSAAADGAAPKSSAGGTAGGTAAPAQQYSYVPLTLQPPAPLAANVAPSAKHASPLPPRSASVPASAVSPAVNSTAHVASAATFLQGRRSATVVGSPAAEPAPLLPPMPAPSPATAAKSAAAPPKPKLTAGVNEMQMPLLDLFDVEGGRVVEFDNDSGDILLSACPMQYPSAGTMAHGVMKLSAADVHTRYFLPLHSKPIRDMHFHDAHKLLMTCAFDKQLRLSSMQHGSVVASFELPQQAWSCAWNRWAEHYVHVGLQTGEIVSYDIRMPSSVPLFSLQLPNKQPVHSLVSVGSAQESESHLHGLIAATGSHVSLCKSSLSLKTWDQFDLPLLPPVSGISCASVAFDAQSGAAVCAVRPAPVQVPPPLGAAAGCALVKPTAPPMCTVFKISAGATLPASSAQPPQSRWQMHLQSASRVQFDPLPQPPSGDVSLSCVAQLAGHRVSGTMMRAAIFTQQPQVMNRAATPAAAPASRLLVACGDDETHQCVVWDVRGERVLARLNGQQAAITQVAYSPTLRVLATVSAQACAIYSTAAEIDV